MDELLKEDRRSDRTLGDLVGAAGVDDGDVRDADEAEDDAEVGAFECCRTPSASLRCTRCRWR